MKNVIIGAIKNYKWKDVEPFVISLKKTGYTGDIIFFANNNDEETIQTLEGHGVTLIPFEEKYPYVEKQYQIDMGILPSIYSRNLHVFSMRYIPYYLYLKNCGKIYQNIMVTDVRDVYFQKDPFDFEINNSLCCFLESEEWPIKKSLFNYQEIKIAFGDEEAKKIEDKLISCCGTTIGPQQYIVSYLEKMIELILKGNGDILLDQGTHNYIVWNNLIKAPIVFFKNHEGPIFTAGYEKKIYKNKQGDIVDRNGNIVNIVHQYDRHLALIFKFYPTSIALKYLKKRLFMDYPKKINDFFSTHTKRTSPKLHLFVKKIKKTLHGSNLS